jgi:sulfoxide reductase heme-binding subunit YedZ
VSAASLSSAPLWYATRSTGIFAFVLLTISLVVGVAATQRAKASKRWPRFATQDMHRNVSLLAMVMLLVHILTTLLDSYVYVGWWALVIPGSSPYQRPGVALGTIAFDLLLVIVGTSLLRRHLSVRLWRIVHLTSYGVWPLSLLHFILTGTDTAHGRWGLWLAGLCAVPVLGASLVRLRTEGSSQRPLASIAGGFR